MEEGLFQQLAQEYYSIQNDLRDLRKERDECSKMIKTLEEVSYDINDILCKNGIHIYEHFEEGGKTNEGQ